MELLAVPEGHRASGLGTALMRQADASARAHRCIGIWLDAYEFQARGFYEKLGFDTFGTLEGHPWGSAASFYASAFSTAALKPALDG